MSRRNNSQLISKIKVEPVAHVLTTFNHNPNNTLTIDVNYIIRQIQSQYGADRSFYFKVNSIKFYGIKGGTSIAAIDMIGRDILSDNVANIINMPLVAANFPTGGVGVSYYDPNGWTIWGKGVSSNPLYNVKLAVLGAQNSSDGTSARVQDNIRVEISASFFMV